MRKAKIVFVYKCIVIGQYFRKHVDYFLLSNTFLNGEWSLASFDAVIDRLRILQVLS